MHIFASILLAFSASLDSLIIGIAYGIKKIKIKFSINIIIALIVTLGTFLSMVLGAILSEFIPIYICNYIGATLLIIVGLFMTFDFYKEQRNLKIEANPNIHELGIYIQNKSALKRAQEEIMNLNNTIQVGDATLGITK